MIASLGTERIIVEKPSKWLLHGAFERLNYGDLLFPILYARVLTKIFKVPPENIHATGMTSFDGRMYGGLPVSGLTDALKLIALKDGDFNFVGVGGETGACDFRTGLGMLSSLSLLPMIGRTIANDSEIEKANALLKYAYVPDWIVADRKPDWIAYNTIGLTAGPVIPQARETIERLEQAQVVSVRDSVSHRFLREHGVQSEMVPDSIVALAALCQPMRGQFEAQFALRHPNFSLDRDYAAIQISKAVLHHYGVTGLKSLILQMHNETGLMPVLTAIGWASYHEDHLVVQRLLEDDEIAAIACSLTDPNIWMTTTLLARARLFVGSSLHGRITALAYDLPRYSLVSGDPKVPIWVDTWEPSLRDTIISSIDDSFHFDLRTSQVWSGLGDELAVKYMSWLLEMLTRQGSPFSNSDSSVPSPEEALAKVGLLPDCFEGAWLRSEQLVYQPKNLPLEPYEYEMQLLQQVLNNSSQRERILEEQLANLKQTAQRQAEFEAQIAKLKTSYSWRMTYPIRALSRLARRWPKGD